LAEATVGIGRPRTAAVVAGPAGLLGSQPQPPDDVYTPQWIDVSALDAVNLLPEDLRNRIRRLMPSL
jgi:hypothetical protein